MDKPNENTSIIDCLIRIDGSTPNLRSQGADFTLTPVPRFSYVRIWIHVRTKTNL